jgi:Cys-tRNA(Pro)/Cys-tRNA(Cys) deacylase
VRQLSFPGRRRGPGATGYERYAITPFGATHAWPVIADATIVERPVVAIGGGARGVNVHVAPADLIRHLDAALVDVTAPEDRQPQS